MNAMNAMNDASDLPCPRCTTALVRLETASVCARCGGVFLGSAVSDTVTRALDPQSQGAARHAADRAHAVARTRDATACPVCRAAMQRYRFGPHLEVDSCHAHGSWYDKGELGRLADALTQGVVAEPVPVHAEQPGGSGLELAERPAKKLPSYGAPVSRAVDPDVQQKINDLARFEAHEEQRQDRRMRRLLGRERFGERFNRPRDGLDLVLDVLQFLR